MVLVSAGGLSRILVPLLGIVFFLLLMRNLSNPHPEQFRRPTHGMSLKGRDPLLQPEQGPKGKIVGPGEANRTSATLLALVRNNELDHMISSMRDLEATWNHKFNYPWTFFNDEPFTEEFKRRTQAETNATCRYGTTSPHPPFHTLFSDHPHRRTHP